MKFSSFEKRWADFWKTTHDEEEVEQMVKKMREDVNGDETKAVNLEYYSAGRVVKPRPMELPKWIVETLYAEGAQGGLDTSGGQSLGNSLEAGNGTGAGLAQGLGGANVGADASANDASLSVDAGGVNGRMQDVGSGAAISRTTGRNTGKSENYSESMLEVFDAMSAARQEPEGNLDDLLSELGLSI